MAQAGYSGTPLPRKLGLKDGQICAFVGLPDVLHDLTKAAGFAHVDLVAAWQDLPRADYDFVHLFTDRAATVMAAVAGLPARINPDGMIWVSWPKKASKVPTDVTEDVVRNAALEGPLVDVKVCAVDQVWSALKLVVRKHLRATLKNELKG